MSTTWSDNILAANPFTENRVNGPSPADAVVDVPAIHQAAFERVTALAREARDERRGLGVVLWGEAGIGKSHLLARLSRWAEHNAYFIYLHNLQASPDNLPRSLLKAVVSILTWGRRRAFHDAPLYRLVNAAVQAGVRLAGIERPGVSLRQAEEAYGLWVEHPGEEEPARAALQDRTVYEVLFRLFRAEHPDLDEDRNVAGLAVRWLGGDYLDRADADRLGLPPRAIPGAPAALADNQQIKQVLVALGRLALCRQRPLVLCFDQVDNLDEAQAAALFRFLEAVLDSAPNLLVVTAGIQASLLRWRTDKVIQDSAWDRIGQFEVALQRIGPAEARQLVEARVRRVVAPFLTEESVRGRVEHDTLYPLGRAWADEFLDGRAELRPRDVVNGAREGWRRMQEALRRAGDVPLGTNGAQLVAASTPTEPTEEQVRQALDEKVAQKLGEHRGRRLAEPQTLPPDAGQLAGVVGALLRQCLGPDYGLLDVRQQSERRGTPSLDVTLAGHDTDGDQESGRLVFVATGSAVSATAVLRRLLREEKDYKKIWLITDARQPLPLATKGRGYLHQLQRRGPEHFRQCELSLEEVAELDALLAVVGLARSGDLEIEPVPGRVRPVSEQETIASHHRQGRYRAAPVLREVLGEVGKQVGVP